VFDIKMLAVLRGSILGLIIKIFAAGMSFLLSVFVARTLGPAESGLFFLCFTIVALFAAIGQLGLNDSLMRFVSSYHSEGNWGMVKAAYTKALLWAGLASCFVSALFVCTNTYVEEFLSNQVGLGVVLEICSLAIPLVALYILHAQALQGLMQTGNALMVANVMVPTLMLLAITFLPISTAIELSYIYVIACALTLVLARFYWVRYEPSQISRHCFPSRVLADSCLPMWGVTVLGQLAVWSPHLLVAFIMTSADVALFSAAQRTSMLIALVLLAVNAVTAPRIAALYVSDDISGLRLLSVWAVRLSLIAALPLLVAMMFIPEYLLGLFGEKFAAAAFPLMIMAIGQLINAATGSVGYLLSMTGHERVLRFNVLVAAVISLILSGVLVPYYGVTGGAIASAVSISAQNLLGVFQVRRILGFNTLVFWR